MANRDRPAVTYTRFVADSQVRGTETVLTPPWGARLREAREARQMSLRELARRLDVSPGHLSQVERDIVAPSISLLYAITSELNVSLDSLFSDSDRADGSAPPGGDPDVPRTPGEGRYVVRSGERQVIEASPGVRWELLTPSTDTPIDFREIVYEPAPRLPHNEAFIRHGGSEFGLILEGRLHVQVEFDNYVLGVGDSIAFDSSRPHRFWNEGPGIARAAWISNATR